MGRTWRMHPKSAARAACMAFAMLLVLPLVLPAAVPTSHADEVGEDELGPGGEFNNGFGNARGTGVRVGPSRSGFNFTTDFAISLAQYQNLNAQGDSRGVSLGMILETVAGAADEDGEFLPLPENLRVDSRDEGASDGVTRDEFGAEEGGFGGAIGSQYVRATEDPLSEVETVMGTLGLGPVVSLEGGTSRATAGIVEDGLREARGQAIFERLELLEGAIVLEGLEWTALHRSGAEEVAEASFTLGDIKVMGESVLPDGASEQAADGLSQGIDGLNEVTGELGILFEAPEKVIIEDTGEVRMTPLKVAIGPSDLSRGVLQSPLGDVIQSVREPLADALIDAEETFGAAFLVLDLALGAFAGGGEILMEIGGARAVTGFQEFDNPFGNGDNGLAAEFGEIPDESTPQEQPQESELPETDSSADLDTMSDTGGSSEAPTPQTSDEPSEEPVEEPVASDPSQQQGDQVQEELAAPAASPGPTGGQALTAALVALLVAAGLGAADFLRLRQSQRTIPV